MKFKKMLLKDAIEFNPKESLPKGTLSKKISMDLLKPFQKFIDSYYLEVYSGGTKFKNKDTIMARITPCLENGKTSFVDILNDNEVGFGSTEYIVLRNKENITIPEFVYYLSISNDFREKAISLMTGTSGRQRVELNPLKESEFYIPSLKEQNKIVKILSSIDNKIKLNNQINDNLYEIAEALFSEICSNGKETKLDEIIYDIQSGSRPKGGAIDNGIPSIGAEKIERLGLYDYSNEKYISQEYFSKMKNGIVQSGDVLLYKDGAYAGKISMALNGFPHKQCAINEHVFILRTENGWANNYLYFLLNHYSVKEQLCAMASSKAAQPGLNQEEVKSVKVVIPEKEIIIEFENKVKYIVEKIIENAKENAILSQLRDTLLPKLMNGEIDLENIEI